MAGYAEEAYGGCGYQVLFVSGGMGEGTEEVRKLNLQEEPQCLQAPAEVGKSTLITLSTPRPIWR